jgi:release factor glutamine methyltransferase
MTLKQAIDRARSSLSANNIEDALLESELLLRHVLKISQTQLYLDLDRELSPKQEKTFRNLIRRRLKGEPTAYITGHREFYGLDFRVNPDVLIPRPESELLVEKALQIARHHSLATIAEIGTGCGAIAISLAINLPRAKIYATDISAPALKVARTNCQKHGVTRRVHLLPGNMLDPLPETVDLIAANLPYVKESELPVYFPVSFEPVLALNGGPDGLDKIRQLSRQLNDKLRPGGYLLLEMGQGQQKAVTTLLSRLFPSAQIEVIPDLSSIDRVVSLCLTKPSPPASGQ